MEMHQISSKRKTEKNLITSEHHYMIKTKPDLTHKVIRDQSSFCSIPYCLKNKNREEEKGGQRLGVFDRPGIQFIQLVVTVVVM